MLELLGVTAGYGSATVLRNVSIRVPQGAVVALIGPNGAGKSTLLRTCSGLVQPSAGRVVCDGVDVTGQTPNELVRAGICHVPEGRGVFRELTVGENLSQFVAGGRVPAEQVERGIDAFPNLGQRLTQVAGTLSGGEQQMLALARAYVTDPTYVLLDEVSMGLAPIIVDEIFEFLDRLSAEGRALLLVEQFVSKALAVADYAALMSRGALTMHEPQLLADDDLVSSYLG